MKKWFLALILAASSSAAQDAGSRSADVYLIPFSHLDFYWGGTREECLARGNDIIARAVRLAKQSDKFRFMIEDEVFVANYVESHRGSTELQDLKDLVKEGHIAITSKWAAIFEGLPDGEVLARNLVAGKRYAREVFGVDPKVVQMSDIPDETPQFPQLLSKADIPFMVMTRMGPRDKSLFNWKAPDGSKTLVWNTLNGYGWGTYLTSRTLSDDAKQVRFWNDIGKVHQTTPGLIYMNWGTDLWTPPDDFNEVIEKFRTKTGAHLSMATPQEFFNLVQSNADLPEVTGEIPSSWPNIVSSLAHMWPPIIPATSTLLSAEKFATINYALGFADYPQAEFDFLWKKLIESMDHNHDGQGGALADSRKIGYDQLAILRGGEILRDSLRNIAERVQVPITNSQPLVVFNPCGWTRDDLVETHVALFGHPAPADIAAFKRGMKVLDEAGNSVPFFVERYSENISRALNLVFVARGIPSLGYKTYYLTASDNPDVFPPAVTAAMDDDKDLRDPRRSLGTNVLESPFYRLSVDRATGRIGLFDLALSHDVCRDVEIVAREERGGNYIGVEPLSGRTIPALVDSVVLEETNSVRAVMCIHSRVADIAIAQRLILYHDLKRLDVVNTVKWESPRLVRLEQLFPRVDQDSRIDYGVAFGANGADNIMPGTGPRAGDEIKPDSWMQSRQIHDWIHSGTSAWGVTIASDHQQIRLEDGGVRAEMLRGTRFTSAKVVKDGHADSLHYPPPGEYVFRYSISSAAGDWKTSKAYRSGINWNNPLLAVSVIDTVSSKSLPPSHSFCSFQNDDLVLSALKKSDLDSSVILRVYEEEGSTAETSVNFLGQSAPFHDVNLLEEDLGSGEQRTLRAGAFSIKSLRFAVPLP